MLKSKHNLKQINLLLRQAHFDKLNATQGGAFGESFVSQTSTSWQTRYTFSGKEKDEETGYSYCLLSIPIGIGARYYDSDLSVWLSVDPMSDKLPFITPYSYCYNHPVNYNDPDGKFPWLAGIIGGAINIGIQYSIAKIQGEEYDFKKEAAGDFASGFLITSGATIIAKLALSAVKSVAYTSANLFLSGGLDESINQAISGEVDIEKVFEESVWGLATGTVGNGLGRNAISFLNKIGGNKVSELSRRQLDKYLRIQKEYFSKELKNKGFKVSGKEFKEQLKLQLENSKDVKMSEINFWKGSIKQSTSKSIEVSVDYLGKVGKDKLEKF